MTGRVRLHTCIWTGACLAALLACGGGGSSNDDPDNGTPTGPPPPPPSPPPGSYTGGWTGTTSQNKAFAMFVEDAGIALIMIGYGFNMTGCSTSIIGFSPFELPTLPLSIANGSFTTTTSSGNRTIAGTLTAAGTANGTLTVNDAQCGVTSSTWTATKASGATVNLAGTWAGSFRSSLAAQTPGTLSLLQAGNTLSGTYSVPSSGAGGTVSGTVLGQTARFTLAQTEPVGCPGTFNGHAVVIPASGAVPDVLFFFYSGSDCLGMHSLGSGSGTKRP